MKKSNDEFVSELQSKHIEIIPIENYDGANKRIIFKCLVCNKEWKTTPSHILRGRGCPKCAINKRALAKRITNEEFLNRIKTINNKISPLEEYKSSKEKIKFKCLKCNNIFETTPSTILSGSGCPYCARNKFKSSKNFKEELKKINNKIEVIGEYSGARRKIKVKCLKCNKLWESSPTNLLTGRGCPKCALRERANKTRKSESQFVNELSKLNPSIKILSTYKSTNSKILVECNKCKHQWKVLPSSLLRGSGCPRCSRTGTSYVEQLILLSLKDLLKTKIISRDRNTTGMELDIYIPNMKFAIEYGAWPWHENKTDRDYNKRLLCIQKGIRLIEIFDAYDGIESSNSDTWFYKENIGKKENEELVDRIISKICNELKIDFNISNDRYKEIKKIARINSRRLTTEMFKEKLHIINPKIEVLGDYMDALTKIKIKCKECGYIWETVPSSLLRGSGCMKCSIEKRSNDRRKTQEQFVNEMKLVNPNITVLGKYTGTHNKVEFLCNLCKNKWYGIPHSILSSGCCPYCKRKKVNDKNGNS